MWEIITGYGIYQRVRVVDMHIYQSAFPQGLGWKKIEGRGGGRVDID